ncbi:MAG TPA: tetratricopeptide repeat protein [Candidatus Binatia bacterium]|nr:tetratricopeptide repeat protein [Candidatus Binatia bacterium]
MKTYHYLSTTLVAALLFLLGTDHVLAQTTRTDSQISYYQQLIKRNPRNGKAFYGLGDALIRKARETGDPSYFNRAEEALKKSLEINPNNAGAMRHLAYVFYSRHEFEPAAVHAGKAIEMDSTDGDSYGILGDALMETGEYEKAENAYRKMMQLEESLYSYSRQAGLKTLRGDSHGAIADLERAVAAGKTAKQPAESIAWAEWQLGSDHFSLGKLEKAEAFYRQSLATYPNYYRAWAGMAQVRAAQKRYDEAIDLYRKAIAILPMPEYIAALGDVYSKIGKSDETRKQYELVEYIGKLNALNKALYNRELAYFYADHDIKPKEGLELAQRELDYRRDVYAYDVLAWNLYKNGKAEEARDAITKAMRLRTKDAKLFYHAGMIYHWLGDKAKAQKYLRSALATNPHFHILFADEAARTLKVLEGFENSAALNRQTGRR